MAQKQKRHVTRRDRKVWRRNALLGTKKWVEKSERARERARDRKAYGWGFNGRSPRTSSRRHRKEHREHRHRRKYDRYDYEYRDYVRG